MSQSAHSDAYQVIWLIRRLFRALTQKANESLEQFGISAADRAVMEFLYPDMALSVPEIAEKYQVSRQHIQVTVNNLLEQKLLASKTNPRHKRSVLITLSAKGKKLFKQIRKNDEQAVEQLFSSISGNNTQVTLKTLQSLLDTLSRG